jgi:hypothetical protein
MNFGGRIGGSRVARISMLALFIAGTVPGDLRGLRLTYLNRSSGVWLTDQGEGGAYAPTGARRGGLTRFP